MIKLKKLLKESSPGFTKREFGDPLPTFIDVMGKHQQIEEFLDEGLSREYRLREKSGTGVPKKYKQEVHKTLDKIWKKFKRSGHGYVETASEEMFPHPTYYAIKYQVARNGKRGKFRDWWFLKITKKGDVEIHPKGSRSMGVVGNLKNPNKVLKALQQASEEHIQFDD